MPEAFNTNPQDLPRDARLVSLILQAADVEDYEPRVLPQLLEFAHRYVLDVLQDAQVFSEHAAHKDIEVEDVRMAIESRVAHSFSGPPSREVMMELAERKNSIPLPLVPDKFGMRLPPERNTLIKQNFQIVPKLHPTKRPATAPMSQYASPLIKRQQLGSFDPAQPVAMQPGFGMPAGMPVPMQMPATGIPQLGQQAQLGDLAPGGGAAAGAMGQMNPMAQMAQMAQMGPMGDNSALMTFGAPVPSAMPAGAGAQQFGMAGMGMGGMGAGMGMNMGMGMGMQPALGAGVQHQTAVTSMGLAMPEVGAPAQPKEDDDYDMDE